MSFSIRRSANDLPSRSGRGVTSEPRDIGTPCKRLSLTQHTSADLHIQPNQRCRVELRPHGCVRNTSFARQTPLRRGAAARSTPLTASVVAILSWTDRGHHVPALTVTSGGRGVGFDMHALGRPSFAHSRRHLNPRASSFSCFSYLLPLRPLGFPWGVVPAVSVSSFTMKLRVIAPPE